MPIYAVLRSRFADSTLADAPLAEVMAPAWALLQEAFVAKLTASGLETLATPAVENDPTIYCQPYGLVREATNPAPMRIRSEGEDLVFDYEEWSLSRVIHMGREFELEDLRHSALGISRGRYVGNELIVETSLLSGDIYYSLYYRGRIQ